MQEDKKRVRIVGNKGDWQLLVEGKPFYIKGAGCGKVRGRQNQDYLKLAKELGANSVRTWGTDQGTKYYLDKAQYYGLMVDAGIWLNWPQKDKISYIGDSQYKEKARKQTLEYVERFKNHPAILMWNIGNEVMVFTDSQKEKIAFCKFLESLIQDVKKIDPHHPVIYAGASYINIKYLKRYVPSLDIVGMNSYGSVRFIQGVWDYLDWDIPYVITEYGHYLPKDRPKDENEQPIELFDYQKAQMYETYTKQIHEFKGYNLGGFVFHLGETTQESMTWWNINEGNLKKLSFWTVYKIYTAKEIPFVLPRIEEMILSKRRNVSPGELLTVEVRLKEQPSQDLSYDYKLSTSRLGVLEYYVNKYIDTEIIGNGQKVKIKAPEKEGVYRVYVFVKDGLGNTACINRTIKVVEEGLDE